jgi:hypothetical protein
MVVKQRGLKIFIPFDSDEKSIIENDRTNEARVDLFIGELPFVCAIREALELRRSDRDKKMAEKLGGWRQA